MDNCQSGDGEVEGLTDEYTELEVLSMVNVGLKSLSKLPSLPKLRKVSSPAHFLSSGSSSCLMRVCVTAGGERQHHHRRSGLAGGEVSQPDLPEPEWEQDQRAERPQGSGEFCC